MEKLIEALRLAKPEANMEDILAARDLYGQGLIDSLDIIIIIDELNAAFGVKIGNADLRREDFMTVANIYALVQRHGGR